MVKMLQCIFEDSKQQLWIGTEEDGLFLFNPDSGSFIQYKHDEKFREVFRAMLYLVSMKMKKAIYGWELKMGGFPYSIKTQGSFGLKFTMK